MKRGIKVILITALALLAITALTVSALATGAARGTESESSFLYKAGGVDTYAPSGTTLAEVINLADPDSEILFLKDVFVYVPSNTSTTPYASIKKGLSFNLDGHTLYFSQSHKSNSFLRIETDSPVTLKNGTAVWNVNPDYVTNCKLNVSQSNLNNCSYALFVINKNNATFNVENVKAYGTNIVYSYSNTGSTVNIKGGEFHLAYGTDLLGHGLMDFRANATVNISDALIDLTRTSTSSLFTLTSYKEKGTEIKTEVNLKGCSIIGSSSAANVLQNLNGHTTVTFDECNIFGSINPAKHKSDSCALPSPALNSVILKGNTLMTSDGYEASNTSVMVLDKEHTLTDTSVAYSANIATQTGTLYGTPSGSAVSSIPVSFDTSSFKTVFDLKAASPVPKFTVTFYKEDGVTPIFTAKIPEGDAVTPPDYIAGSESNGWYKAGFDGWTTSFGSADKVTDFTITADTSFYPARTETESTLIPDLSGASYNLTLTDSITLNLYLPKTPENVTNVKVTNTFGNTVVGKSTIASENGTNTYYKVYEIANLSPTKITDSTTVTVSFKIDGQEYSKSITLSPVKYAKTILADSESSSPIWSDATHSMIADMIRYSNEISNAAGIGYVAELNSILERHGKLCSPTNVRNAFSDYDTNMSALSGYVSSMQLAISEFKPRWIINLDTTKRIIDVSVSLDGYYNTPNENGINFGNVVYGIDESETVYSGNYIKTAYIEKMPMCNMDRDMTVTVTLEGGSQRSATYNLSAYYRRLEAEGEELRNWQLFLEAFRAFAASSSSYKYSEGIVSADAPTKDFFDCDHKSAKGKSFNQVNGQYCDTCKTYIFFYDSYINKLNYGGTVYSSRDAAMSGKDNSYASIQFCHAKANQRQSAGYKSGCVATPGAVYYLGYSTLYNGTVNEITVQTDTQWDGAYILSDESAIDVGDPAFNKALFCFRGKSITANGISYNASGTDVTSYFSSDIKAGAKKLPFAPGIPLMLQLTDATVKHYIRNGANQNDGKDQSEVILIDEFGNVSNTTPIEWDYTYAASTFTVKAYTVTDEHIKLSGLGIDANGNTTYATLENITNNSVNATAYKSTGRGITARRSNVTVEGIRHEFTEDDTNLTPRQAYQGFRAWLGNNIVFKDMSVEQHMSHYVQDANGNNTTNLLGSYEFSVENAINVSWINCKVRNFFNSNGSLDYKGLFGTNGLRNAYLRDCVLTSFDSHSAAGNVTIENSTFEHINFIGAGEIRLKDVTVYQSNGGAAAIILRQDYGSRWRGDVYFDGLELRYDPNNYTTAYIDLIKAYYTNWDFGYGTTVGANERPRNVYANNVTIMEYSRKAYGNSVVEFDENGKIKESTLKRGTKPLGIYTLLNSQLTNSSYDYSAKNSYNKNPMGCTENIYITNSSSITIKYPTHKFFKNMNIYKDGTKISWY